MKPSVYVVGFNLNERVHDLLYWTRVRVCLCMWSCVQFEFLLFNVNG